MVELRNEDPKAFQFFMRMPSPYTNYDDNLQRLTPALIKETCNQLESTPCTRTQCCCHMVVHAVCDAIVHEYAHEMLYWVRLLKL
ncbi:hypothetical protein DPMN_141056 [Dreissena polymorpha]|uniref:Uncharacterized protein n=1 Tax=Dreissena polymorpha TaxID=45954 RepID=A0A9D4G8R6_DREPO|nr:hypothetical protein DPMN_141056 [Dreissena polymorpha]